jgi:hypothetical protein
LEGVPDQIGTTGMAAGGENRLRGMFDSRRKEADPEGNRDAQPSTRKQVSRGGESLASLSGAP